jgi:predicted MFS family arabinose efflux permease
MIWFMAIACGLTAANLFYHQPLLADIGHSFQASIQQVGLIPTLSLVGHALGMLLLAPLGDMLERRQLTVTLSAATACAFVVAAMSPNLVWLVAANLVMGFTTIIPVIIIPLAAQLARPKEQGKVIGILMCGLLSGVLLSRVVSGFIGAKLGWRAMHWIAAGLMIVLAVASAALLPKSKALARISYPQLMRSLPRLIREHSTLRKASLIGAMLYGGFNAFWTTLVFFLESPPYHYGSEVVGLFGLVGGVAGIIASAIAGRLADKRSPKLMVEIALATTMLSFLVLWLLGYRMWGLVIGAVLLEFGVESGHVSNQACIYSLPLPEAHNRMTSVYSLSFFLGGALGAFLGTYSWSVWQWSGVCAVGLFMVVVAFAAYFRTGNRDFHT